MNREDELQGIIDFQTEEIKNLKVVIAAQKQTIKNQGAACEEKHNILCGVKEEIDEYFLKG